MPSLDSLHCPGDEANHKVTTRWVSIGMGTVLLAICGIVASLMLSAMDADMRGAAVDARNVSVSVNAEIGRTMELYGLSLLGAIEGVTNPDVMASPKAIRQLVLFDKAATASGLGKILVLDERGDTIADSTTLSPQAINYADRDYFRAQRDPGHGLYVSDPLVSRSTGDPMIALSRRVDRPDGSFGGVVVGTIHLDYFRKMFAQVTLPPGGTMALVRNDGVVLMRFPASRDTAKKVAGARLLTLAAASPEGDYEGTSPIDGIDRLYHYKRVGELPLILNVGLSTAEVRAQWRSRNVGIVLALGFCCIVIGGLTLWLGGEVRKRSDAQEALTLAVETDALTGIANRRCLDRTLPIEWCRARRQAQAVSVLMIDADHFKSYNDMFGHAGGDAALRTLAECLVASGRRTGDLAARYGGEEFTLVLPNTDAEGAMAVAAKLRSTLADRAMTHPGSPLGRFTVSVGVATASPGAADDPMDLVAAADAALYASKRDGRDRATLAAFADRKGMRLAA